MEIREYRKATRCDHRGRLRRCAGSLIGQCQYCARGFCGRHGNILEDGQEICVEPRCERLRDDVAAHLVFKSEARVRNQEHRCGEDGCPQEHTMRCDRCGCRFCEDHLRQVIMTVTRGGEVQSEAAAICDHCRARLPLWAEE
ncbi:MAG: hypothetical protein F4W99_05670 [Chloroflexi bacterium]|nr:hypothetical protein [Chloroflexota bacterium]MYJ00971.1 hypothetical protein [Chloroflexota bacterium]